MRYVFLSYVSRSGSTLLARLMADSARDLLVLPEVGFVNLLLAEGDARLRRMSADELGCLLRLDRQLSNLELTADDLAAIAEGSVGGGARAILDRVVTRSGASRGVTFHHVLLKKGRYLRDVEALRALDPDAAFIHVYRDGRAAASSMLRAERPRESRERLLAGDPRRMARRWRETMLRADARRTLGDPPLHEVRYEELVARPREIVSELLRELGIGLRGEIEERSTSVVGTGERALHPLVEEAPRPDRALAWRRELSLQDGVAFELVAGGALERRGYPLWFLPRVGPVRRSILGLRSRASSLGRAIVYYGRRLRFYSRRPAKLRLRLKRRV